MTSSKSYPAGLLAAVLIFWTWSGIEPHDTRLTWVLETLPFMIALPVMLLTHKRFPLTNLSYTLIAVHAMILMLGGHYSYAKVPLGFWMEDWFGWTRNNYDKIGHLMQGFGPAIYTREIIARTSPLRRGKWLAVVSVAVPQAFSSLYEIIEWLASLTNPTDTEAFLGTQTRKATCSCA
jgi:putative membrane protein